MGLKIEQATACCNRRLPVNMRKKKTNLMVDSSNGKVTEVDEDGVADEEPAEKKKSILYF